VANELKSNWTMTAHLTCIHLRTFCQYAYTAFDVYYLFIYLLFIYLVIYYPYWQQHVYSAGNT